MINRLRRDPSEKDGGFILLESMIAMGIVIVVMTALTTFFITVNRVSSNLKAKQFATMVADGVLDQVRAMQPSDTFSGHSTSAVTAQFAAASAQVAPWLASMTPATDDSGATAKLPMTTTVAAPASSSVTYTENNYVGACSVSLDPTLGTDCRTPCPTQTTPADKSCWGSDVAVANFLRVVVALTWADSRCPANTCAYVTATLLSKDGDPNFLLNQTPPNPPVAQKPADQTSAINDGVTLQLAVSSGTGVNPITWSVPSSGSGSLPSGLTLSTTGLITGTVGGSTNGSGQSVTVTATDAFGRTSSQSFNWKVIPDLISTIPGTQTLNAKQAMTTINLTATGGSGTGYKWTVPASGSGALPAGIVLTQGTNTASLSGTPTTPGGYPSQLTIADSAGRTRTFTISWNIQGPTLTAMVDPYRVMPGWVVTGQSLPWTCPTSTCTLTLAGMPTGLGLATSAAATSGTASLTLTAATGTAYLVGTVAGTASGTYAMTLTVKDTKYSYTAPPDTATWKASVAVSALGNVTALRGQPLPSQQLPYSCNSSCTITIGGVGTGTTPATTTLTGPFLGATATGPFTTSLTEPAGDGTFFIGGTMPAVASTGTFTETVTITDNTANTSLTESATWTVS